MSQAEIIAGQCAGVHPYRGPDPGVGEIANAEFRHADFGQDRSGPLIARDGMAAVEHDVAETFPQTRCLNARSSNVNMCGRSASRRPGALAKPQSF